MSASAHHRPAATHGYALVLDDSVIGIAPDRSDPITAGRVADVIERGGFAHRAELSILADTENLPWEEARLTMAERLARRVGC